MMNKTSTLLVSVCMLVLGSCAQTGMQIGTHVDLCCPGNYAEYSEYGVQVVDMPIFLRDYVVAEFDEAFQRKGLTRNDRVNDVRVVLRYNHVNLSPEQEEIDPFVRVDALNIQLNYIAQIVIEIYETSTNRQVWAGSISRIHQVVPGEYMHQDRAAPAFLDAFTTVLESYPELAANQASS